MSEYGFKFEIGQIVAHRGARAGRETYLFVVERNLQQCSGGIQRFYNCRSTEHTAIAIAFNEIELRALTDDELARRERVGGEWEESLAEFHRAAKAEKELGS